MARNKSIPQYTNGQSRAPVHESNSGSREASRIITAYRSGRRAMAQEACGHSQCLVIQQTHALLLPKAGNTLCDASAGNVRWVFVPIHAASRSDKAMEVPRPPLVFAQYQQGLRVHAGLMNAAPCAQPSSRSLASLCNIHSTVVGALERRRGGKSQPIVWSATCVTRLLQ